VDKSKPLDMLVIEPTKIDGQEVAAGTILKQCEPGLAMDLASGGKARAATDEAVAWWRQKAKSDAAASAAAAEAAASRVTAEDARMASMVAAAVASALKAAGVVGKAAA